MGKPKPGKTRPTVVRFLALRKTFEVMANMKALKDAKMYVTEDLSKEELTNRKSMVVQVKRYREQGHHAIIKNNKIYVDHKPTDDQVTRKEENLKKRQPDEMERPMEEVKLAKENPLRSTYSWLEQRKPTAQKERNNSSSSTASQRQRSNSNSSARFRSNNNTQDLRQLFMEQTENFPENNTHVAKNKE